MNEGEDIPAKRTNEDKAPKERATKKET